MDMPRVLQISYLKQLADLEPTERPIHCSDKRDYSFM